MANQVVIKVDLDDKGAVRGIQNVTRQVEGLRKADSSLKWDGTKAGGKAARDASEGYTVLKNVMANLATAGVAMAGSALKDMAASVVEIGSGFETAMSKVAALSGASGTELAALEAKAREMGASTTFSASQAADALGYMALAGWDAGQSIEGLPGVLALAQAGEMDLAAASDLVTDYLSAFNMSAAETGRMVDVMAYAQAHANTTVEGLGMALKNCAANANAAGLDIETTSAAISMMANQGLKGSEAGTALTAVLRDMTAKMEDGAIAIGDQSVAVMDAQGNYRDFAEVIADVEAATAGMGDAEKAAALQSTFTADSIKGLNLLLNAGAGELSSFRDELYGSSGAAEEMARVMADNLAGDLAAMGSAFEELALRVYEGVQEPLRGAAQLVTGKVVPALTAVVDNAGYAAIALGGVGAAVAAMNFGKVAGALSAIPRALAGFTGGPILAVVAALTALAAGAKWAYDNVQPFHDAVNLLVTTIADSFGPVAEQMAGAFSSLLPTAMEGASSVLADVVVPAIEAFAGFISSAVVPAVAQLGAFIQTQAVPALSAMAQWAADRLLPVLSDLAGFLLDAVVPALDQMASWVMDSVVPALMEAAAWFGDNILPVLGALASFIVGTVLPAVGQVADVVLGAVVPALEYLWTCIEGAVGVIQAIWQACWDTVAAVLSSAWDAMSAVVGTVLGVIQGVIQAVTSAIAGDWKGVWEGIGQVFSSIINGVLQLGASVINGLAQTITSVVTGLYNTWASIWRAVLSVVSSVWSSILSSVTSTVDAIVSGVTGTFWGLVSTVQGIFDGIKNAIVNPIETAKGLVRGIIDAIAGFFTGFKITLPHIKLPHFAINPPGWQIGDLLQGKIPSLGIDWYAKGGYFAGPSVIGVGENGDEAVLPLENRRAMAAVGEAIGQSGAAGTEDVAAELRALRRELPEMLAAYCPRTLTVNRREFARLVRDSGGWL